MQKTQRLRPFATPEPRSAMPIVVGAAFAVLALGYALLVIQPELVRQLVAGLRTVVPGGPGWAVPAMASGIAIAGGALGVFVLSRFVRGVQRAPYVWFAPVLVGFSMVVMGRLPVTLPFERVPGELFAVITAFMWLGGGALMQLPGWPARASGALLFSLPAIGLVAAYAVAAGGVAAALTTLDHSNQFFLFVFWLTWFGVGMLSVVTREARPAVGTRDQRRLSQAVEHARHSDARVLEAERRATLAEEELRMLRASQSPLDGYGDDAIAEAMGKKSPAGWLMLVGGVALLAALAAGGYYAAYEPMRAQAMAEVVAAENAMKAQEAALAAVKDESAAERTRLQAELEAAQEKAVAAQAALAEAEAKLAAEPEDPGAAAAAAKQAEAEARAAAAAKAKVEARQARAQQQQRAEAKRRARKAQEKRAARREQRERSRALAGNVSDDPIAGLDGF